RRTPSGPIHPTCVARPTSKYVEVMSSYWEPKSAVNRSRKFRRRGRQLCPECFPTQESGQLLVSVFFLWSEEACAGGLSFKPPFRARIPSPRPFPSSGSFLGPNTSKAIKKITSRCIG